MGKENITYPKFRCQKCGEVNDLRFDPYRFAYLLLKTDCVFCGNKLTKKEW